MAITSPTRASFICCRQRKLRHVGVQRADSAVEGSGLTHQKLRHEARAHVCDEPGTSLHSCCKNIQLTHEEESWEAYVIFWYASLRWTILIMKWRLMPITVAWLVAWLNWREKTCLKMLNHYKSSWNQWLTILIWDVTLSVSAFHFTRKSCFLCFYVSCR